MKKGIRKEAAAIVLARATNEKVAINNGDISSLISSMEAMQLQLITLTNALTAVDDNVAALTNTFNDHVHAYTDVDNLAATLNKTTSIPQ